MQAKLEQLLHGACRYMANKHLVACAELQVERDNMLEVDVNKNATSTAMPKPEGLLTQQGGTGCCSFRAGMDET